MIWNTSGESVKSTSMSRPRQRPFAVYGCKSVPGVPVEGWPRRSSNLPPWSPPPAPPSGVASCDLFQLLAHLGDGEALGQPAVRAMLAREQTELRLVARREEVEARAARCDGPRHRQTGAAGSARDVHVHEDDVRLEVPGELLDVVHRSADGHVEAVPGEHPLQELELERVVVDDEDSRRVAHEATCAFRCRRMVATSSSRSIGLVR